MPARVSRVRRRDLEGKRLVRIDVSYEGELRCSAVHAPSGRSLETDGLSRLALEGDLKGALRRGELSPFYQPIVRLSTGALSGFEALVRWRHPRRGLLMPEQFLPLCDEMGLMPELGAMMMREAAGQLKISYKALLNKLKKWEVVDPVRAARDAQDARVLVDEEVADLGPWPRRVAAS